MNSIINQHIIKVAKTMPNNDTHIIELFSEHIKRKLIADLIAAQKKASEGEVDQARRQFEAILKHCQEITQEHSVYSICALLGLSQIDYVAGNKKSVLQRLLPLFETRIYINSTNQESDRTEVNSLILKAQILCGKIYLEYGKYQEAKDIFSDSLKQAENIPHLLVAQELGGLWLRYSQALYKLNQLQTSLEAAHKAVDFYIQVTQQKEETYSASIMNRLFRLIFSNEIKNPDETLARVRFYLAQLHVVLKNFQAAEVECEWVLNNPNIEKISAETQKSMQLLLGQVTYHLKDYKKSLNIFKHLYQFYQHNPKLKMHNTESSMDTLIELSIMISEIHQQLGQVYIMQEDYPNALNAYEAANKELQKIDDQDKNYPGLTDHINSVAVKLIEVLEKLPPVMPPKEAQQQVEIMMNNIKNIGKREESPEPNTESLAKLSAKHGFLANVNRSPLLISFNMTQQLNIARAGF